MLGSWQVCYRLGKPIVAYLPHNPDDEPAGAMEVDSAEYGRAIATVLNCLDAKPKGFV